MKKRVLTLGVVLVLVLSILAGCSTGSAQSTASSQTESSAAESGADASDASSDASVADQDPYPEGTFRYMSAGLPQYKKVFFDDYLSRQGERGAGVTVEYETADAATLKQKMILGFTSAAYDDLPDVIYIGPDEIASFQKGNMLVEVTDYVKSVEDKLVDGALAGVSYKDKIYAYPDEVRPQLLFYNTKIFEQYDIDIERCDTIEGWIEVGKELKEKSGGTVYLSNYDPGKNTWRYYGRRGFMPQAGGRIWDDDGNIVFGSDENTKKAMNTLATLKENDLLLSAAWFDAACFDAARANQIATFYIGAFYDEHLRSNLPDQEGVWNVRPAPKFEDVGTRGAPVSGGAAIVNKPDAKYAQLFQDIWTDYNFNYEARNAYVETMIEESGPFSNTLVKEALEDPFWQQKSDFYGGQSFMQAESEGLKDAAAPLVTTTADTDADAIISPEIEKFMAGEQNMDDTIANIDAQLKQQIGKAEF